MSGVCLLRRVKPNTIIAVHELTPEAVRPAGGPAPAYPGADMNNTVSAEPARLGDLSILNPAKCGRSRTAVQDKAGRAGRAAQSTAAAAMDGVTGFAGLQGRMGGLEVYQDPSPDPAATKLFVGGLSWQTCEETLRQYFGQFGQVDLVQIMKDPFTQVIH